jgi:hypothetical protein
VAAVPIASQTRIKKKTRQQGIASPASGKDSNDREAEDAKKKKKVKLSL